MRMPFVLHNSNWISCCWVSFYLCQEPFFKNYYYYCCVRMSMRVCVCVSLIGTPYLFWQNRNVSPSNVPITTIKNWIQREWERERGQRGKELIVFARNSFSTYFGMTTERVKVSSLAHLWLTTWLVIKCASVCVCASYSIQFTLRYDTTHVWHRRKEERRTEN